MNGEPWDPAKCPTEATPTPLYGWGMEVGYPLYGWGMELYPIRVGYGDTP